MEVIKRKNGIKYREMIWINGKCVKSPAYSRKTDCQKWLAERRARKAEAEIFGGSENLHASLTFSEFGERWLLSKMSSGLAKKTIMAYESHLRNHINPKIGKRELKDIRKVDLEKLQTELMKKHNAKGTNLIMTMLKAVFKEAHRDGYIVKNPAEYLSKLKEDPGREEYWTPSEVGEFLRFNREDELHDFFLVAINTGMRKGELAALCWDRVDFGLNQIEVSRTRDAFETKQRTKTTLRRIVPMNGVVRSVLLKRFQGRRSCDYVFTDGEDQPIEVHHIYRRFARAQERAKIKSKIPFHGTRHTFATNFMMNGGNVFDLQKILGHTDIKMTMRYAHYSREHLQKAMTGFSLGDDQNKFNHNLTTEVPRDEKVLILTGKPGTPNLEKAE